MLEVSTLIIATIIIVIIIVIMRGWQLGNGEGLESPQTTTQSTPAKKDLSPPEIFMRNYIIPIILPRSCSVDANGQRVKDYGSQGGCVAGYPSLTTAQDHAWKVTTKDECDILHESLAVLASTHTQTHA